MSKWEIIVTSVVLLVKQNILYQEEKGGKKHVQFTNIISRGVSVRDLCYFLKMWEVKRENAEPVYYTTSGQEMSVCPQALEGSEMQFQRYDLP